MTHTSENDTLRDNHTARDLRAPRAADTSRGSGDDAYTETTPPHADARGAHDEALTALGWSDAWATHLRDGEAELIPARVCAQHRGALDLLGPDGPLRAPTPPQDRLTVDLIDASPCVGDWALLRPGGAPRIVRLLPRRSRLVRKAPGAASRPQIVGVNLDRVFLVTSMNADFSPRRLERYMAAALAGGVDPAIVLSKIDLQPAATGRYLRELEAVAAGVPVIASSAALGLGLDAVSALLGPGQTAAFVGSSGVGKSSLLNALFGSERMAIQALRGRDETGQHTTTHRALVQLPGGRGLLMDTPGMREFQPWSDAAVDDAFADLLALAEGCRFRDCGHGAEPGCALQAAISEGRVTPGRLRNWLQLQREADHLERRAEHRRRDASRRSRERRGAHDGERRGRGKRRA